MYIIDRLQALASSTDQDSSEFILAAFFLDPSSVLHKRLTLRDVEEATFISQSTVNRFCRDCGSANLKSFRAALEMEFEEERLALEKGKNGHESGHSSSSRLLHQAVNECAERVQRASKVLFYGNLSDVHMMRKFIHACILNGIRPVILSDWSIAAVRAKLQTLDENDCVFLVDTDYSLPMLKMRMDLQEEVIRYQEFAALNCLRFFIGKSSPEHSEHFTKIPLPDEEAGIHTPALSLLDEMLRERMMNR